MTELLATSCPYCGEPVELFVDGSAGEQDYIEDCPVCCRPMRVHLAVDAEGDVSIQLAHEDEA